MMMTNAVSKMEVSFNQATRMALLIQLWFQIALQEIFCRVRLKDQSPIFYFDVSDLQKW